MIFFKEDSLNPDAPRTLMDLLGESSHRARNLKQKLAERVSLEAERELEVIKYTWKGFEVAARENGDEDVAQFIRDVFINPTFGEESEGTSIEI